MCHTCVDLPIAKARDLIDSLYQGYPIGYLIAWQNPSIRLKDGTTSAGKKILIDGQQRVTALMAALLGEEVMDDDYRPKRIKIAFHPIERKFEVSNPAIQKDNAWIPDISILLNSDVNMFDLVKEYCKLNSSTDERDILRNVEIRNNEVHEQNQFSTFYNDCSFCRIY